MPVSLRSLLLLAVALCVTGCASRPINPPLAGVDRKSGYRFETRAALAQPSETLVILAFSGGGTRAAASSFGVLEELRRTQVTINGGPWRILDEADRVTGVSGGSFTALAQGLYGEKLFDEYPQRFLKRNVQGELLTRFISPGNWSTLLSEGWGRSEMAAQLYDNAVDRLRKAAGVIVRESPEYQRLLRDLAAPPKSAPRLVPTAMN
jgi:NTE family protein